MTSERVVEATTGAEKTLAGERFSLYQARLRAEEIDFETREQYNVELQKQVVGAFAKLNKDFERQSREVERQSKIEFSVIKNEQRIKLLQTQQEVVEQAKDATREKLRALVKAPEYPGIVTRLIEQGLNSLGEDNAVILCIPRDNSIVEKCIKEATSKTGHSASLNKDFPLDEKAIGGVVVANAQGTIRCDNTFEERLNLGTEGSLPQIRKILKE